MGNPTLPIPDSLDFTISGYHLFQVVIRPTCGGVVMLKTGRWEVPGSNPGRTCRPSHSEFSKNSKTPVNTG